MRPIPDPDPSGPAPNHVESVDERVARRRGLMKAAAAESRAMIADDLLARTRLISPTGRDDITADEESPISEKVAAQAYLRTALLASAELRRTCETRQDEMRASGASEDEVLDALLGMARAQSESSKSSSVPIGSFDAVMTAWERGGNPGEESSDVQSPPRRHSS